MNYSFFLDRLSGIQSLNTVYAQSAFSAYELAHPLYIGWEQWENVAAAGSPFLLTNKGTARRFGRASDDSSVTKFVLHPPDDYLENWEPFQSPLAPEEALASITLVADDISPDSVLAVLILLARMARVDPAQIPAAWIEAVDSWERSGDVSDPWHSWCALESALAHRHFPREGVVAPADFARGWAEALRFAAHALALQLDPLNIPELPHCREYQQAKGAMEQEQEIYWDWLQRATVLQFSLPLEGAFNRRMLVDGLLVEAQQITGAAKVFLRNDRTNSPLGRGFSFLALYTPPSDGHPMDITLSVDPGRGVSLLPLWQAIERRETRAWEEAGEARPTDAPRPLEGVENIYEQPWYIDPSKTLLARPRALRDGRPGSRLDWQDLRELLWTELNPLRGISVHSPLAKGMLPLLSLPPDTRHSQHDKLFYAARWDDSAAQEALVLPRSLTASNFFIRILAALLHHGRSPEPVGFSDLPALGSWELVSLDGGLAIVMRDGLFLLDDWSAQSLQLEAIRDDFHRAATLDAELLRFENRKLRPLVEDVRSLLNRAKHAPGLEKLLLRTARLGTELAAMRGRYAILPEDPDARLIRAAIDGRWSLARRLDLCDGEIRAVETSLRSLNELHTLRIGRFVSIYGFALFLAIGACPYIGKAAYHALYGGPESSDAPGLFTLLSFAVTALLMILVLKLWNFLEKPLKKDSGEML